MPKAQAKVRIHFDGRAFEAEEGQSLAAALWAAGVRALRLSPRAGTPRGPFCMMGLCQECVVEIDGRHEQSCLVPCRDGLRARRA